MLNLHNYISPSIIKQKKANEHIMIRLDNIKSLQRTIVHKLYKMNEASPKIVHLTSEKPQYVRNYPTEKGEKIIFEPP